MSRFRLVAVLAVVVLCGGCGGDGVFGGKEKVVSPSRDMSLVEARREAIGLELELHALLSAEFGVGQWKVYAGLPQASWAPFVHCADGYSAETWELAVADAVGDERWSEAVERLGSFLGSRGFSGPRVWGAGSGKHIAWYENAKTGARVELRSEKGTLVSVDTGCAKGEYVFDGWPQGTEAVPVELRGPGRGRDDLSREIWPKETPEPVVLPSS